MVWPPLLLLQNHYSQSLASDACLGSTSAFYNHISSRMEISDGAWLRNQRLIIDEQRETLPKQTAPSNDSRLFKLLFTNIF